MIQKFKRLDQAATISSGKKKKKTKTVRPEQNISQLRLVSAPSSPICFLSLLSPCFLQGMARHQFRLTVLTS